MAGKRNINGSLLSAQQAAFVKHYLQSRNATQSVIKAGYSSKGASVRGSMLLANSNVAAAVAEGETKFAEKMEITTERVLREVARMAFFDPRKMFHDDGNPKGINELDDDTAAAVAGLDIETRYLGGKAESTVRKVKVADKNAAAEKLMKYLGLFREDNKQKGAGVEELIAFLEARQQTGQTKLPIRPPKTKKN